MNKKYSFILILTAVLGLNSGLNLGGNASFAEEYPELLPSSRATGIVSDRVKPVSETKAAEAVKPANSAKKSFFENLKFKEHNNSSNMTELDLKREAVLKEQAEAKKAKNKAKQQALKANNEDKTKAAVNKVKEDKEVKKAKKPEKLQKAKKAPKAAKKPEAEKKTAEAKAENKNEFSARELKRIEKKKEEYKDYFIPTDGYMPVGNVEDRSTVITGSVQKTLEFNLADCLELALINHPKIKAAYANASANKAVKNQTVANYTPRLNFNMGLTRNKPDTSMISGMSADNYTKYLLGTIGISQLVYDFGVTQNQYTIDKIAWESSKIYIESVVNDVICSVKDGYYNLLYAIARKQVALETVEQYSQMYNQAKAFYEVGTKPKVDMTIAAANLSDARSNLIEASNNVDIAVSKLNNAMGLPFVQPYVVDTSIPFQDVNISMKEVVEIANNNRPDLKINMLSMEQANQYVKLAKKSFMPSLEFRGNWSMGGREDFTQTNWYDVGGYLSFPTVNPVLIRNQIVQAKALYEQEKFSAKSNVNDIYYEIQQAYVRLVDARERIPATKLTVQQAKESYELSQGRYRVGVCDAIELRDAQIQYANAKLAYISNLYNYNSAKALLEKAIGQTLKPLEAPEKIEI